MPLANSDLDFLCNVVSSSTGNVLTPAQRYLVESRLSGVATETGLENIQSLVAELKRSNSPALKERVSEALTINETSFFRDEHPFQALRDVILPQLIRARRSVRRLSILCAACSTGQEPYSVALILKEHFSHLADWNLRIVATDVSDAVLAKAKQARYSPFEVSRGLPPNLLAAHFVREGTDWVLKDDVRRLVEFRKLNLVQPWPYLGDYDIVFLRNVLIYFDQASKQAILNRVLAVLRPDGYLFVGGSESLLNLNLPIRREETGPTIVYRPNL